MKKPDMRSCLKEINPYVPGKPADAVRRELGLDDVVKMASNENPLGPSPHAIRAAEQALGSVNVYPDSNYYYLRNALADMYQVDPGQLIFGNGSDEILSFLTLTYLEAGDETLAFTPSFSEYPFATRLMGAFPRTVPLEKPGFNINLEALLAEVNPATRLIFLCSPNNPTGTWVRRAELDRFVQNLPDRVLLVLDQAYIEYCGDPNHPDGLDYIADGYPVIILRTFSKVYGLAGLRIGYGIAPTEVISDLSRVREPFNVNSLAETAALAALSDSSHVAKSVEMVEQGRLQVKTGLAGLGLEPVPDQANFFFVDIGMDSKKAFEALLQRGVIVRPGYFFGCPTHLRVTYGRPEENSRFIAALREVLEELS